jgi:hypothetical protein
MPQVARLGDFARQLVGRIDKTTSRVSTRTYTSESEVCCGERSAKMSCDLQGSLTASNIDHVNGNSDIGDARRRHSDGQTP